jgi:hypothetical protein
MRNYPGRLLAIAGSAMVLAAQTTTAATFLDCQQRYGEAAVERNSYAVHRITVTATEDYTYWGEVEGHDERAELAVGRGRGVASVCNLGDRGTCTGTDTGCGYWGLGHVLCEGRPGEGITCGANEHCPGQWSGTSVSDWTRMNGVTSATVTSFHPYNCDCIRQTPGPSVGRYVAASQAGHPLTCAEGFGSIAQIVPKAGAIVSDGWSATNIIETGFLCGAADGTTLGVVVEASTQQSRHSGEESAIASDLGAGPCALPPPQDLSAADPEPGILGIARILRSANPGKQIRRIPRLRVPSLHSR